jgi:hypothetical protein
MRRWTPSPSLAIATLALVVAVGGGSAAIALKGKGRVHADDIRRGAVKKKKIANFAVTPPKTNLGRFGFSGGEVTTTSGPPVSLPGGPSVTVFVPRGGLVAVYAEVEMRISNGAESAQVHLFSPVPFPGSPRILDRSMVGFGVMKTTTGDNTGVAASVNGGTIVTGVRPGRHTFSLRYSSTGGATAVFRDRKLWVTVLG